MRYILTFTLLILSLHPAQAIDLRIQYPARNDTVDQVRIRFAGWVSDTTAQVLINGIEKRVYRSGAFVDLLDLEPGWNVFTVKAAAGDETITDTLRLYRKTPRAALPELPVAFVTENMLPGSDLVYYAPDEIILQFQGSPGGRAFFEIDDLTDDPLPMEELSPQEAGGLAGVYRGVYVIREGQTCDQEPVVFTLTGKDGDEEEWETDRHISVRMTGQPVIAETNAGNNIVFKAPWSEIMLEVPAGIRFPVVADMDRWIKLRISDNLTGLISRRDVNILSDGAVLLPVTVNGFASRIENDWQIFSFRLRKRVPFDIRQDQIDRLRLDLYQTYMHDEWTTFAENVAAIHPDSSFLEYFEWEQITDDLLRLRFKFRTAQLWGFRGWYEENTFNFAVRRPPLITSEAPFRNLVIALDAGHGGAHRGAVGATGYMEKDANLIYTKELAKLLKEAGATVVLTRTADSTMWLKARADTARKYNAHILVWLHNNSIGSTTDPLSVSGTSTYYTHLQGMPFAMYVYPELLNLGLKPFGRVHRSYYITRQTDMVVFLVEGAFLSHPEDEIFLLDKANLKRLAQAVFDGMEKYLLSLAKGTDHTAAP